MKKWIAVLCVLSLLAFGMTACTQQQEQTQSTPSPSPSASQEPEPSSTPEAQETQETQEPAQNSEPAQEESYTYTSTFYGFTVTMPASWEDDCIIEEEGARVSFYSAANRHLDYGDVQYDAGELFTILVPEDSMKTEDGYVYPSYEVIGQYNGADMLVVYPTDVQFNTEDEAAQQQYRDMQAQIPEILTTVSFG